MAAVELTQEGHPVHVRFNPINEYKGETFAVWARSALHPTAHLVTDGCVSFNAAGAQVATHGAIIVGKLKSSELEPFRWLNLFISNLKTSIRGTYPHFDFAKYRHRYLAEAQYRVTHRFDLASLVGRLANTCVHTAPCPEPWLQLAKIGAAEGSS